jgi:hypothetical protein
MLRTITFVSALMVATSAGAQHAHQHGNMPEETGQATFAAIAEIAALLNSDPATDWETVNLDALREHLLDMDRVTMGASVDVNEGPDATTFAVMGTGEVIGAIQRMTAAHSGMLATETGWVVSTQRTDTGAVMRIATNDPADHARVKGLGFFGVMTIGAHHQMHHLAIARGVDPHH